MIRSLFGRRSSRAALTATAAAALVAGAVAVPAVAAPAAGPAATSCAHPAVPAARVSYQLFTSRNWIGEVGLDAVLAELSAIGYEQVQPYRATYRTPATELRAMLKNNDLAAWSGQGNVDEATFDATIEYARTIGQKYMGSGGFAAPGIGSYADTLATAATLNRLGERSVRAGTGKVFGHNHWQEFTTRYPDPVTGELKSAWQIMVENTDPRWVTFEVDVFWAADAGVDVAALIREYGNRIELLHVKDGFLNGDLRGVPADVGEGELDWAPILEAALPYVKQYVVERDNAPTGPETAADSFRFLTCQ
ncbi:sugar phosphate isomerase/epimerase family protein [Actinophytocola sp. NPDC049390]|uniref:sugar phosphate isomerase/epimerase family protein n=1 Tax=Actinophytocola sp. NPDC049390 TaxID=3363894 RepID=UPI0037A1D597